MTAPVPVANLPAGRQVNALVAQHVMGVPLYHEDDMVAAALQIWKRQPSCHCFLPLSKYLDLAPASVHHNGFEAWRDRDRVVVRQQFLDYSRAMVWSWTVVEQMRSDGWLAVVKVMPPGFPYIMQGSASEYAPEPDRALRGTEGRALAEFVWMRTDTDEDYRRRIHSRPVIADTAPLAICLAALVAKGVQ